MLWSSDQLCGIVCCTMWQVRQLQATTTAQGCDCFTQAKAMHVSFGMRDANMTKSVQHHEHTFAVCARDAGGCLCSVACFGT